MSLQVASWVPVRKVLSNVERTTSSQGRAEAEGVEPMRGKPVQALTCRDVMDEARRRLASKDFHWE